MRAVVLASSCQEHFLADSVSLSSRKRIAHDPGSTHFQGNGAHCAGWSLWQTCGVQKDIKKKKLWWINEEKNQWQNQSKSFIHIIQILSYLRIVSAACLRCLAFLRPLTPLHHDWITITARWNRQTDWLLPSLNIPFCLCTVYLSRLPACRIRWYLARSL